MNLIVVCLTLVCVFLIVQTALGIPKQHPQRRSGGLRRVQENHISQYLEYLENKTMNNVYSSTYKRPYSLFNSHKERRTKDNLSQPGQYRSSLKRKQSEEFKFLRVLDPVKHAETYGEFKVTK